MDLLQDVKSSSPPIDSQQYQSYQSPDTPSFPSGLNGTHQDSSSMTSAHASHMSVSGPTTIFPSELHSAESMAMSIQMQSVPLGSMDMVTSSMQDHIQQNMLSEFSSQPTTVAPSATTSAFLPDPPMNGIETLESQHQISSSPSTATASTSVSLVSSPSTNSMVNSFMAGSSSLATALDGSRSRSASSASPGHLSVPSSELGFASGSSAPSTTASNETSFPFTSGYEQPYTVPQSKENSPDATDPHLLALGDMLKNIAKTANSGSDACTNGQTNSAATLVDQLTKHVLLVAKMAARMNLSDQPTGSPTSASSPHASNVPAAGASPPSSTGLNGSQDRHLNGLGFETSPNTSLDPAGVLDSSEMSRKRCASTLDGDRVVKALKLEPSDEPPLSMPPPAPVHSHSVPHLNVSPSFTFSAPTSIPPSMATIVEHPSLPPLSASSMPGTRPPSSSGLSHPSLHSHPSTHFPPRLDFGQQRALPPTDFTSLPLGPASAPAPLAPTSFAPAPGAGWSDTRPTIPHHAHSVTGVPGTVSGLPIPLPLPLSTNVTHPPAPPSFASPTHPIMPTQPPISSTVPPPIGRVSRSGSMSHPNPFAFGIDPAPLSATKAAFDNVQSRPPTSGGMFTQAPSPEGDEDDDDSDDEYQSIFRGNQQTTPDKLSPGEGGGESSQNASGTSSARRGSRTSPSADAAANHTNEIPQEYRADVERIFFDFLNKTCSNLDATDSKGEPIHQTLMAKKMQRLDESPDFRPFKFRIQAFTNAFLEELARQGFPEEKIPMKKIRNFLWNQPYISRFNEEGKKSKSKGNHIWHVDAKRTETGWTFRPFQRKLAGVPPGVAYIGLRWSWTPRIWDPQASRANMPVTYTSPALPPWLSWEGDTLSGIPPPDAESCDVTVQARFVQDGKEESLSHTVHVNIAPMTAVDASFTPSRRPSLVGDALNPRRVMSDSVVSQTSPPRGVLRAPPPLAPGPTVVAPDSQVVQVLTTAAQRVAQEAQSQVVASPNEAGHELHSLAKQQHVLTVTAQAVNNKSIGDPPAGSSTQSNALAAAAQQVVLQAARQVAADRTVAAVSSGIAPAHAAQAVASQVTVKEVSVATQSAVAQAVEMVGPLSSEVDVLMTAKSLLQQQTRVSTIQPIQALPVPGIPVDPASIDPAVRPHSTGNTMSLSYPVGNLPPAPSLPPFYAHAS